MKYLLFFCLNFQVFAMYPHVDLGQGFYREVTTRQLSSEERLCESGRATDCMEFDHQIGPNVLRFSLFAGNALATKYFDFKLQSDCIHAENLIESAQSVSVRNIRLSQGFSGEADVYIDGVNLLQKCDSSRLPSSH